MQNVRERREVRVSSSDEEASHTHIHTERDWLQYADQRRRVNRALFPLVLPLYPALSFSRAPVFRSVSTGATKSLALIYPNLDF